MQYYELVIFIQWKCWLINVLIIPSYPVLLFYAISNRLEFCISSRRHPLLRRLLLRRRNASLATLMAVGMSLMKGWGSFTSASFNSTALISSSFVSKSKRFEGCLISSPKNLLLLLRRLLPRRRSISLPRLMAAGIALNIGAMGSFDFKSSSSVPKSASFLIISSKASFDFSSLSSTLCVWTANEK